MTLEANAELDRVFGGDYGRSPIQLVEIRIRPVPAWNSAAELARRDDPVGFVQGVNVGHDDALAHLEPMIRDCVGELLFARQRRDQSHRESSNFRMWTEAAERERGHLQRLLFIRRALKGGNR